MPTVYLPPRPERLEDGQGIRPADGLNAGVVSGVLLLVLMLAGANVLVSHARGVEEEAAKVATGFGICWVGLGLCIAGAVEQVGKSNWREKGWTIFGGQIGAACYIAIPLLVMWFDKFLMSQGALGGGEGLMGLGFLVLPAVPLLALTGFAMGVIGISAGSRLWGWIAALFVPIMTVFTLLASAASEWR